MSVINNQQLAIIGTRKPTPGGRRIATEFALMLGQHGFTVTSGLAIGIDTAAHKGAILSDAPTIGVLANGLDMIYPKSNYELADKICENGAIVSEFPVGTKPKPGNFPRRNRIISGLSVGTLVVEAAMKSGSLITARLALEQGREVFAIPGSIHNPMVSGCHALISNGAKLTSKIDDILEEIGPLCSIVKQGKQFLENRTSSNETLDEAGKLLLDNIGYEPVTVDQLVIESGISVNLVNGLLSEFELKGLIDIFPGGKFARRTQGIEF